MSRILRVFRERAPGWSLRQDSVAADASGGATAAIPESMRAGPVSLENFTIFPRLVRFRICLLVRSSCPTSFFELRPSSALSNLRPKQAPALFSHVCSVPYRHIALAAVQATVSVLTRLSQWFRLP